MERNRKSRGLPCGRWFYKTRNNIEKQPNNKIQLSRKRQYALSLHQSLSREILKIKNHSQKEWFFILIFINSLYFVAKLVHHYFSFNFQSRSKLSPFDGKFLWKQHEFFNVLIGRLSFLHLCYDFLEFLFYIRHFQEFHFFCKVQF